MILHKIKQGFIRDHINSVFRSSKPWSSLSSSSSSSAAASSKKRLRRNGSSSSNNKNYSYGSWYCSVRNPSRRGGRVKIVHYSYFNNRSIITSSPAAAVVAKRSDNVETAARWSSSFATTSTVCFVFRYHDHRCHHHHHLHPEEGEGSCSVRVAAVRSSYARAWSRYWSRLVLLLFIVPTIRLLGLWWW